MTDEAELPDVWINTGDLLYSDVGSSAWLARRDGGAGYTRYVPAARLDALRAELDAVRADVERYSWLKRNARRCDFAGLCVSDGAQLDARIDAARKERTGDCDD